MSKFDRTCVLLSLGGICTCTRNHIPHTMASGAVNIILIKDLIVQSDVIFVDKRVEVMEDKLPVEH